MNETFTIRFLRYILNLIELLVIVLLIIAIGVTVADTVLYYIPRISTLISSQITAVNVLQDVIEKVLFISILVEIAHIFIKAYQKSILSLTDFIDLMAIFAVREIIIDMFSQKFMVNIFIYCFVLMIGVSARFILKKNPKNKKKNAPESGEVK